LAGEGSRIESVYYFGLGWLAPNSPAQALLIGLSTGNKMNKHLLLGVPNIDHQHDELLRSLQHLLAAGKCDEGFSEVISRLTIQIHDHFQSEERFMAGLALPPEMMREHEREHSRIIEELTQMHLDTMAGLRLSFGTSSVISCPTSASTSSNSISGSSLTLRSLLDG